MPDDKAPGIDGIISRVFKLGKAVFVPVLCRIFNVILETGVYPDEWCHAIIVSIHKGGNKNDRNSYRGISLLCNLGKLFVKS